MIANDINMNFDSNNYEFKMYLDGSNESLFLEDTKKNKQINIFQSRIGEFIVELMNNKEKIISFIKKIINNITQKRTKELKTNELQTIYEMNKTFALLFEKNLYSNDSQGKNVEYFENTINVLNNAENLLSVVYKTFEKGLEKKHINNICTLPSSTVCYSFFLKEDIKTDSNSKTLQLKESFDYLSQKDFTIYQSYNIKSFDDVVNISLYDIFQNRPNINQCQNCGKYFIPKTRSNEKYCDNISPQNSSKTCKEFSALRESRKDVEISPIQIQNNRISQAYRMRIRRATSKRETQLQERLFIQYKREYRRKLRDYSIHKINEEEFIKWLNENSLSKK